MESMDVIDRLPEIDDLVRAVYPGIELKRSESDPNGMPTLVGYFAVFNTWTEIDSIMEGHFMERFAPGCFSKTIKENINRIQVLFDHGEDPSIGKKVLGPINVLREEGDRGGYYEVQLLNTSYNHDLIEGLRAGLYGSSFRFKVIKEDLSFRPKLSAYNPKGLPERTVTEARIREFGPVTFPVYEGATSGVRSMTDELHSDKGRTSIFFEDRTTTENDQLYKRSRDLIGNRPWAIHPEAMETMVEIMAERVSGYRPTEAEIKERIGSRSRVATPAPDAQDAPDPIAVIDIFGTIMPHGDLFSQVSGSGAIDEYQAQLQAAMSDPAVQHIVLNIDSPGGAVAMVPEFAHELLAARSKKPITAVANTDAFSAAYWLASQATEISVTPSGAVGSVGVLTGHQDVSAAMESQGIKTTMVTAGKYKGELSPLNPLTEEAKSRLQSEVDAYYEMFVNAIAKGRGVTAKQVNDNYGQGRTVMAKDAVNAGMADRVESFDTAMQRLRKQYGASAPAAKPKQAAPVLMLAREMTDGTNFDMSNGYSVILTPYTGTTGAVSVALPNEQLNSQEEDNGIEAGRHSDEAVEKARSAQTGEGTETRTATEEEMIVGATAIPYSKTEVVDEPWDGPAEEKKLNSPITKSTGFAMYAWYDQNGNDPDKDGYPDAKSDWKFPHHIVADGGKPGAANANGVRNALARLTNAKIPESEKAGVRAHLEKHLNDFNARTAGSDDNVIYALVDSGAGAAHSSATSREDKSESNASKSEEKRNMPNTGMTIEEVKARLDEIKARQKEIVAEFGTDPFTEAVMAEWNAMIPEREELLERVRDYDARQNILRQYNLEDDDRHKELVDYAATQTPSVRRGNSVAKRIPDNIYAVEEYRNLSRNADDLSQAYRDGAMKAIEVAHFSHPEAKREEVQNHVAKLLDQTDDENRSLARRILTTSSPTYQRAFTKYIAGGGLTAEEQRSLSLTGSAGGYAVPIVIDPTVILTSNGVLNPIRQLARVETIVGNHWTGVSSAGVSASYSAEATEVSDGSPSFSQPTADVEKAQAFIPFSIEIGEDWGALQAEMALMLQDAKDTLESDKFLTGLGHGSNVPEGLLVGGTAVTSTAGTATFAVADLYSLENSLAPRWRPRAAFVANRAQYNRIRQFDTAGGASLWVQLQNSLPPRLIGYPAYEWSNMVSTATTGSSIVMIGDFSQFLILDRVGMNIELVPLLLNTANNRPDGTRGLYAYWRNTSKVLTQAAFKTLKVL